MLTVLQGSIPEDALNNQCSVLPVLSVAYFCSYIVLVALLLLQVRSSTYCPFVACGTCTYCLPWHHSDSTILPFQCGTQLGTQLKLHQLSCTCTTALA